MNQCRSQDTKGKSQGTSSLQNDVQKYSVNFNVLTMQNVFQVICNTDIMNKFGDVMQGHNCLESGVDAAFFLIVKKNQKRILDKKQIEDVPVLSSQWGRCGPVPSILSRICTCTLHIVSILPRLHLHLRLHLSKTQTNFPIRYKPYNTRI